MSAMSKPITPLGQVYNCFLAHGERLAERLGLIMQFAKASRDTDQNTTEKVKMELSKLLVDAAVALEKIDTKPTPIEEQIPF